MKTFMLGWEFPPFISGGLGTACYGLTKAMDKLGIKVTFVLPCAHSDYSAGNVRFISGQEGIVSMPLGCFKNVKFRTIVSKLKPYIDAGSLKYQLKHSGKGTKTAHSKMQFGDVVNYGMDMFKEVSRYAEKAVRIAQTEGFDIVHAHDWMTYPAGIAVSQLSGKPLVVHVHSTEFDRSGENVNQRVYDIERHGMHAAARVIAVSGYTKNLIVRHYGIAPEKVDVVHNAVEFDGNNSTLSFADRGDKIVLFLGRITMQKGPEYFLAAAKKVLEVMQNVKFIMAGDGDMLHRIIELAARLGIGHKVLFAGFLRGDDVRRAYQMADLYVMPSVSEPFGIAPLEAMRQNVPVLISKQSGIAEAVVHALKVDFWDINEMANKMIAVLRRPALRTTLCRNGFSEAHRFNWEGSAMNVRRVYEQTLAFAERRN
jgi:glycosyltransferase involved in cell wall biosynthesis